MDSNVDVERQVDRALAILREFVDKTFQGNEAAAARALGGCKYQTFHQWYSGRRRPRYEGIAPIIGLIDKFLSAEGQEIDVKAIDKSARTACEVPIMGATGAGNAVELFYGEPEEVFTVPSKMHADGMISLEVIGDSMEPTIPCGSYVGIVEQTEIIEGRIYLVDIPPFGRVIKRIKQRNGVIILVSDNPMYEPIEVAPEGYEKVILGRVVWVLRRV